MKACKYAVVGVEDISNFRLAQILRQLYGKENVGRFLELSHLEPFLAKNREEPVIICCDLFGFDLTEATDTIGRVRDTFPKAVFNLYLDKDEYRDRAKELPAQWRGRLAHYYKTFKESDDVEYGPIVRASLRGPESEALYNLGAKPIRLTPIAQRGLVLPENNDADEQNAPISFVSYSRNDWEGFVSKLVGNLAEKSQKTWIDQNYLTGGDDWMDAIGQALQACDTLLLVLTPESVNSKYVKMEYRYFFKQDKPIIPILYRQLDSVPFELATLQHIDFTKRDHTTCCQELLQVLSRRRSRPSRSS